MKRPSIIVISGPSASGKTTIGKNLGSELSRPFFYKDAVKERLFDSIGWKDRAWSLKLGAASYSILYYFLECELEAGRSCIVESNFEPEKDIKKFQKLKKRYNCSLIPIFCTAREDVLLERFIQRLDSNTRHPGHVDDGNIEMVKAENANRDSHYLDFGTGVIEIDTTDFDTLDYEVILKQIEEAELK